VRRSIASPRQWAEALVAAALALAEPRRVALAGALVLAAACRGRVPDVGPLTPVLQEDGRVVELLLEADSLAERDPDAAARNLRESVLPRARANWEAAGRITVEHPRAQELRRELVRITGERVGTVERYAGALSAHDPEALRTVLRQQAALDQSMDRLEGEVQAASRAPAERGCGAGP
jgi:hypothetical protein